MGRVKPPVEGHVVENYKIGNTKIKICDDYIVKTPEEVQAILDRIANMVVTDECAAAATADCQK